MVRQYLVFTVAGLLLLLLLNFGFVLSQSYTVLFHSFQVVVLVVRCRVGLVQTVLWFGVDLIYFVSVSFLLPFPLGKTLDVRLVQWLLAWLATSHLCLLELLILLEVVDVSLPICHGILFVSKQQLFSSIGSCRFEFSSCCTAWKMVIVVELSSKQSFSWWWTTVRIRACSMCLNCYEWVFTILCSFFQ